MELLGAGYLVLLGAQALRRHRHATAAVTRTGVPARAGNPWRTGLIGNRRDPKIAVFRTGLLHIALTAAWLGGCRLLPAKAGPLRHTQRPGRARGAVLVGSGLVVATTAGCSVAVGPGVPCEGRIPRIAWPEHA